MIVPPRRAGFAGRGGCTVRVARFELRIYKKYSATCLPSNDWADDGFNMLELARAECYQNR